MAALVLPLASALAGDEARTRAPFSAYADRGQYLATSPASANTGLNGFVNPALLTYVEGFESTVAWSDETSAQRAVNDWGMFSAAPHLGFGMLRRTWNSQEFTEYRLGMAGGDRRASFGVGYGWARGAARGNPASVLVIGSMVRPRPEVSLGLTWTSTLRARTREAVADLGVRPFRTHRLTLFSDFAVASEHAGEQLFWSAGASFAPFDGVVVSGRYLDGGTVAVGLRLGFGALAVENQIRRDRRGGGRERSHGLYSVRVGGDHGDAFARLKPQPARYLEIDLKGPVKYRRFSLFDRSRSLVGLLALIERARTDASIRGVAINLSGLSVGYEKAWELRQQLWELRRAGKHVVIYIDNIGLRQYHLASVADRVLMDPSGLLRLEGFVAGSAYFKGSLEKLGVGVEEFRFKDYKAALEPLTREGMSPQDREQWQAVVDDIYAVARDDISQSRGIDAEELDRLIDDVTLFLPQDARRHGLVDTLARWDAASSLIAELEDGPVEALGEEALKPVRRAAWGEPPRIAVVYALGVCAMDVGIRARALVKEIETVREAPDVKAVVLRIDSPGGEVLASDLVASAIRLCKKEKPVIVSQGSVAASGGYWISMYADHIVASPLTLTGSIGVIFPWFYNKGLKEKLGVSTDHVRVGERADAAFGMPLPLLGSLPDRNLDDRERQTVANAMQATYDRFVDEVATARKLSVDATEAAARGRIWSGARALEVGLVDELGGLTAAIHAAKERADLSGQSVRLDEYPRPELFDLGALGPGLFGRGPVSRRGLGGSLEASYRAYLRHLEFHLGHNGQPLLLAPDEVRQWHLDGSLD